MHRSLAFIFCLVALSVSAQEIHWAEEVVGYSSQRSNLLFSAEQACGMPNKYPDFSFTPCAWMPDKTNVKDSIFIHLGFKQAQTVGQVILVQSFDPEVPSTLYLRNSRGLEQMVMISPTLLKENLMRVPVEPVANDIVSVRIVWSDKSSKEPFQLDAVGVTNSYSTVSIPFYTDTLGLSNRPEPLSNLNSPYDEVLPVVSPDGRILYFDRKKHPMNTGNELNDDIWYARRMQDSTWSTPLNMGKPLNDDGHNFINAVSADGNMVLLGNTYSKSESPTHWMSSSERSETGWQTPVPVTIIGFSNKDQYNEFSMSADGQYIVLSIESDETNGMRDIYISKRISDRYYSKPKNLGKVVNTAAVEMSPFLAADGQTLYYASNGLPGYGGYDIYVTRRLDETWENWSPPLNLGAGINTADWEAYFTTDAKGEMAYFCSSLGVDNLDLYRVKLSPAAKPEDLVQFTGKVLDRSGGTYIAAKISYVLLSDSLSDEGHSITYTGESFNAYLKPASTYLVTIQADGYFQQVNEIVTPSNADWPLSTDFFLIPKRVGASVVMENIYFRVNTSILVDSSFAELEKIALFLNEHPWVHMEVRGHTNGLCDDAYCLSLSTRRARSVVDFLIDHGVDEGRLSFKGIGKTEPVSDNNTPEGRSKNQRVEFVLTQVE
jgi:OOP family OmpA-OmpF porin